MFKYLFRFSHGEFAFTSKKLTFTALKRKARKYRQQFDAWSYARCQIIENGVPVLYFFEESTGNKNKELFIIPSEYDRNYLVDPYFADSHECWRELHS